MAPAYSSHGNRFCVQACRFVRHGWYPAGPPATATVPFTVNIPDSVSWTGAAGYIVYDWNDHLEFVTRGEWFRDADGARSGLRQTLGEITETINYKIPQVTGLLARLEYRHDESSAKPFFGNTIAPNNSLRTSRTRITRYSGQDTIMAAAIYSF